MRVVIFEDDDNKYKSIENSLLEKSVSRQSILRVTTIAQFARISSANFDLCIIDILMPGMPGGQNNPSAGREILQMLDYSGKRRIPTLAITSYPEEADRCREDFAARGCIIYDFERKDMWSQALDVFLAQARDRGRYDFIIFTALEKERRAFSAVHAQRIESVERYGIDHWDLELEGRMGSIVLLPRSGLVNASITVARVLEQYAPAVVSMAGICAGVGESAKLGQLLVAEMCWEYQSGKWYADRFESEPYQVSMSPQCRLALAKMLEKEELLPSLESGFNVGKRPADMAKPQMAIFSTGSAVIASAERLKSVEVQHRKVAGIDMEVFGFHRAVELSGHQTLAFSAKVVVDKADASKDDSLHPYGCFLSAKFSLQAISYLFQQLGNSAKL